MADLVAPARPIVLVADDDDSIRTLFAAALTTAGFEVVQAIDGESALAVLAATDVSLVLLDLTMPGLGGREVIHRLRSEEATVRVPIVLVTGAAGEADRVAGLEAGADDYLVKPVSPNELVARARAHVRTYESWRRSLRRSLEIRRSVSTLLRRMPREGSAADTASRAIAELAELIGVDAIALLQPRGGRYGSYAAHGELRDTYPPGSVVQAAPSARMASRAAEGYWVQALPERPDHAVAYFPFEVATGEVGLMVVADRAAGPMAQRVLNRLADLAEVAELMGGFLAPLAEIGAAEVVLRRRVETIIEGQAFAIHFQPIVRLDDRSVVGFEALTRFADGVAPGTHFAEAGRVGLGPELELAAVAAAIDASDGLPGKAKLHVNLSPARLLDTDRLPRLIERSRRRLVIELTEHEAIGDYEELNAALAALGGNVDVAVDDAGSGYASLRHIQALRPQAVKLDLQWVHALESDAAIGALVTGLVQFGRELGCDIIGEGVQTKGQHAALQRLGVEFGQGFRFGRPAPAEHWV